MPAQSHFFAYLSRMKLIQRWGLMKGHPENVQEHSLQVALVAHMLAVIRNELYGGKVSPDRVGTIAIYHDAAEILTGDLPAPIKYFNKNITRAYKEIETAAASHLLEMVPEELQSAFAPLLVDSHSDDENHRIVKAADLLCAYMKCTEEVASGNREFLDARSEIETALGSLDLPEVDYFVEVFLPSLELTLDGLAKMRPPD